MKQLFGAALRAAGTKCAGWMLAFWGALLLLALPVTRSAGQVTASTAYQSSLNMKGYAMCAVPGSDEFVAAGTLYDLTTAADNSIHFLHLKSDGTVIHNVTYNLPNIDERAVDIDALGTSGYYAITTLMRDPSDPNVSAPRDKIRFIIVNATGAVSYEGSFMWNANTGYKHLYPTNAMAIGNLLYVVGYASKVAYGLPNNPLWGPQDTRVGFMLCYNTTTHLLDGGANDRFRRLNTSVFSGSAPSSTDLPYDYDIPLRMHLLARGPYAGRIFVTGMCNINIPDLSAPSHDFYTCGTLATVMRQDLAINSPNIPPHNAIVRATVSSLDTWIEGGVDVIESADESTTNDGDIYVVGNYFDQYQSTGEGRFPKFNTHNWWVSRINRATLQASLSSIYIGGVYSRSYLSNTQGCIALSALPDTKAGAAVVAGLQTAPLSGCSYLYTPSGINIDPFLSQVAPGFSNTLGISLTHGPFYTQLSQNGTSPSSGTALGYDKLGAGFANLIEGPPTAVRVTATGNNEIALTTGVWNPNGSGSLNMKFIRTKSDGTNPSCNYQACDPEFTQEDILNANSPGTDLVWDELYGSGTTGGVPFYYHTVESTVGTVDLAEKDCSAMSKAAGTQGAQQTLEAGSLSADKQIGVYPNPATQFIGVQLNDRLAEAKHVSVALTDLTGKTLAVLFDGTPEGLDGRRLNLPAGLAKGIYIVSVVADNCSVAHQATISVM